MRTIMTMILILILVLVITACGGETPAQSADLEPTTPPEPAASEPAEDSSAASSSQVEVLEITSSEDAIARVNGQTISRTKFEEALDRRLLDTTASSADALAQQVLETMIETELVRQAASRMDISITDEDVLAEIETLKASVDDDPDAWANWLTLNNYTEAELADVLKDSMLTNQVRDALLAELEGDVSQVRARHILLATESEAQAILERLNAGEDFAALAAEYSLDMTSRDNGGDLSWFTVYELMDPALAEVAFSLAPGETGGPVATRIGYHIIQTTDTAERTIEPERMPLLMESLYSSWLAAQRTAADIERFLQ